MEAKDAIAILRALPRLIPGYAEDYNKQTRRIFAQHGAQDLIVCVAGFRLVVTHLGSTLVSIRPKAKSAGRGEVVIWPYAKEQSWVDEHGYYIDRCARPKTGAAVDITYLAWLATNGDVNAFYRALGKRGHCAICGATLTDELSMSRGIGPECYRSIYGGRKAIFAVRQHQAQA